MNNSSINKLIILFILDRMEIALEEDILIDACRSLEKEELNYMEIKATLPELISNSFVYVDKQKSCTKYKITPDGRKCLSLFYWQIPTSIRTKICEDVVPKRRDYKLAMDLKSDYFANSDGTYTLKLKLGNSFFCEVKVDSDANAQQIYKKWQENGINIYNYILDTILE